MTFHYCAQTFLYVFFMFSQASRSEHGIEDSPPVILSHIFNVLVMLVNTESIAFSYGLPLGIPSGLPLQSV